MTDGQASMPKSRRLSVVVAENPAVRRNGGSGWRLRALNDTASAASRVTPRMLNWPWTMKRSGPNGSTRVETKRAIESDRVVANVLVRARQCAAHLYSAGAVDADSVHVASGYLSPADIAELLAKGAVGDVLGRYIDADGHIVDPELDARTVGLTLDELRGVPMGIAVLSGPEKHAAASAIVGSGLCSVLITDEETAAHVLAT